jgi:hypothetical protein
MNWCSMLLMSVFSGLWRALPRCRTCSSRWLALWSRLGAGLGCRLIAGTIFVCLLLFLANRVSRIVRCATLLPLNEKYAQARSTKRSSTLPHCT